MRETVYVWGSMNYACNCGATRKMFLEVGVEGPKGMKEMPSPFSIICPECGELEMVHVDWRRDDKFEICKLQPGDSYFELDAEYGCGKPVHNFKVKENDQ